MIPYAPRYSMHAVPIYARRADPRIVQDTYSQVFRLGEGIGMHPAATRGAGQSRERG